MTEGAVLHYVTQWLWLSDSFVHNQVTRSGWPGLVVSRGELINRDVYAIEHVLSLSSASEGPPPEGERTADAVVAALGDWRPSLVHLHHGYGLPDAAELASRLEVPLVASFWGYDVTVLPTHDPTRLMRLSEVAQAVVPSRFLRDTVARIGVPLDRISVVPAGIDLTHFTEHPLPEVPRVVFVGRFVEKKGIQVLTTAWRIVRRAVPGATLVLVGYGPDVPPSDPDYGIAVVSPSSTDPRRQVREVIRSARVYVSPSLTAADGDSESQHVGNLEAQAMGRPVVTSDHGGIPEFVCDDTAIIVPPGDVAALADALINLLRDRSRCEAMGAAGRAWVSRFEATEMARKLDAVYGALVP